jgi:hypothetical protein
MTAIGSKLYLFGGRTGQHQQQPGLQRRVCFQKYNYRTPGSATNATAG